MIYLLIKRLTPWLQAHDLGYFRVFTRYPIFRATLAILTSFLVCIILGRPVIAWLRKQKIGDLAGFAQKELDSLMANKKGTPTMGGVLILVSIAISTLLLGDLTNFYIQMALVCMFWLGAVGAADDWLKLTAGRRAGSRQGLTSLEKILFQIGLGVVLSIYTYHHGQQIDAAHTLFFPFFKNIKIELGLGAFILLGTLVLTGSSNAVNLTDGLDGLAAGCVAIVSFAFFILAMIAGTTFNGTELASTLYLPYIESSNELAIITGAMTGACLGFLWFNCNPASVFMGDTGSLALGGLLGYVAIVIRQEIMLFLVGGIFVIEAISVMLQVGYFKYTRHRYGTGRRIFLVAPLHHHFQRKGWTETQVVVRFWLISAMLAAMALATVKLR